MGVVIWLRSILHIWGLGVEMFQECVLAFFPCVCNILHVFPITLKSVAQLNDISKEIPFIPKAASQVT